MIASIKNFFAEFIQPAVQTGGQPAEHALQVATAALLLEMMRMDDQITAAERESVTRALRAKFGLGEQELATVLALAEEEAREAAGYHQFTSLINKGFGAAQKVQIIDYMWQVAFADGHLSAHEEHLLRKIADLLYVPHGDYIAAKSRARAAMAVPAGKP